MTKKIYVASSWRNTAYPGVTDLLRGNGYEIHDWRNAETAFKWSAIDPDYAMWTPEQYRAALGTGEALRGFTNDHVGMMHSDACVLLLPSGRSAHVEAGVMAGWGKPVIVFIPPGELFEPELMYMCFGLAQNHIALTPYELLASLKEVFDA